MKVRIRTWTSESHVESHDVEVPDGTVVVEVDVMSDAKVKFVVDKTKIEKKEEKKPT